MKLSNCIIGSGSDNGQGYLRVYVNGKQHREHRLAWETSRGPIPDGKQIDHLCRNRSCVNVEHMEVVSTKENTLRGNGPTAINAKKTYCNRGHAFTQENVYISAKGSRHCRRCQRIFQKEYKARVAALSRATETKG